MMREMKLEEPLSQFAKDTNEELEKLINLNNKTQLKGEVLWCRAAQIIIEETICSPDELKINSKRGILLTDIHRKHRFLNHKQLKKGLIKKEKPIDGQIPNLPSLMYMTLGMNQKVDGS